MPNNMPALQPLRLSLLLIGIALSLNGCHTLDSRSTPAKVAPAVDNKTAEDASRVKISKYPDSGIVIESLPLPTSEPSPVTPSPKVLIPAAKKVPPQKLKDGRGIAAYQKAMDDYVVNLSHKNLAAAESNLIQAQRIAPQSADVYRELARLANLKQQARNAEAFARKGLTFAQNNTQRKQLWQQILHSAQLQKNTTLIQQAQQNISRY
jgi:hypothetical protein